jgi:hypothetical protein
MAATRTPPSPQAAIRRFDVFAEYNRQQAMRRSMRAAQAKGYGLWLAKVVAARKFGRIKPEEAREKLREPKKRGEWHSLSGKPQTDKLFDSEIVDRMGGDFYRRVFRPAIRDAIQAGQRYEDIRDSIRKGWKPAGKPGSE